MSAIPDLRETVLTAWRTNNRVTARFIARIPGPLWSAPIPGVPTRTIRAIAAHLHNARCRWLKTLGREHGIVAPRRVDQHSVTPRQLVAALAQSSRGMAALLELGIRRGGHVPPSKGYVWRNLALDVGHVLTYFVAHEAHHRGQILMAARQLKRRLPTAVTAELWHWRTRAGDS